MALADGTQVSVGDQIATRRNDPTLCTDHGERVRNRHIWTVTALDRTGELTASHPERGTVVLPADYVGRYVELGWAVTGYGNQGDTVDIGLAVLEAGTTRNHAYVALTRGRSLNAAWVPNTVGTLDAADQFAAMIARSPNHESALATQAQLRCDAGLAERELTHQPSGSGTVRQEPTHPANSGPSDPALDERTRAIQARLDRLRQRSGDRSLSR